MFLSRVLKYSAEKNFVDGLFNGLTVFNRRADLAKSITLVESTNPQKKLLAQSLLNQILNKLKTDRSENKRPCLRVGKSLFPTF